MLEHLQVQVLAALEKEDVSQIRVGLSQQMQTNNCRKQKVKLLFLHAILHSRNPLHWKQN